MVGKIYHGEDIEEDADGGGQEVGNPDLHDEKGVEKVPTAIGSRMNSHTVASYHSIRADVITVDRVSDFHKEIWDFIRKGTSFLSNG